MSNRNIIRKILLEIEELKVGESILIDDLSKKYKEIDSSELLSIVSMLATRYIIKIDGKYSHECHTIEKYNKIVGLDRDGFDAVDAIRNDKIWNKTEEALRNYDDFSIFTSIALAKKIIEKEFDELLK